MRLFGDFGLGDVETPVYGDCNRKQRVNSVLGGHSVRRQQNTTDNVRRHPFFLRRKRGRKTVQIVKVRHSLRVVC